MIQLAQEEIWSLNIMVNAVKSAQQEYLRTTSARDSYIKLLEGKYDAVFNPKAGQFEPKPKEKPKKGQDKPKSAGKDTEPFPNDV